MKPKYFLICLLGATLAGCNDPYLTPSKADDKDASRRHVCFEYTNGSRGKCTPDLRPIFSNYVVKQGQIYWMEKITEHGSCYIGAMTFFFDTSMWRCLFAERYKIEFTETRNLIRVAPFSSAFQPMEASEPTLVDWQREQLVNYAKDKGVVYFKSIKLDGADPNNFAVVFPFGNDEMWKRFSVSKSGKSLFIRGKSLESMELSQFRAFTPIRCPGNGLTCIKNFESIYKDRFLFGVLGWIEEDIVFLRENDIVRFPGRASPDMFMFMSRYRTYLYTHNKFYELSSERDKLLEMDMEYYLYQYIYGSD